MTNPLPWLCLGSPPASAPLECLLVGDPVAEKSVVEAAARSIGFLPWPCGFLPSQRTVVESSAELETSFLCPVWDPVRANVEEELDSLEREPA